MHACVWTCDYKLSVLWVLIEFHTGITILQRQMFFIKPTLCAFHFWKPWYIGSNRRLLGVQSRPLYWQHSHPQQFFLVIMEDWPLPNWPSICCSYQILHIFCGCLAVSPLTRSGISSLQCVCVCASVFVYTYKNYLASVQTNWQAVTVTDKTL